MNPIGALTERGQSVWLDFIRRRLLDSGELDALVAEGVRGLTSNPSIFEKAIAGSDDYDDAIAAIVAGEPGLSAERVYERPAIADIQRAADTLRPVYDESAGADGFVSLEVSPHLAHDTEGTIAAAKRLWDLVDRPNLMVKVPATPQGVPAIETLIGAGINVNVTLLFSVANYEEVARAYLRGLEAAADPASVASVASFFVSRVDSMVDERLEAIGTDAALALRGKAAVANARWAYERFGDLFGDGFAALRARERGQRVLWASTSTKNVNYSDVLYIEELVGPETVNTVPPATLDAWRDHGGVRGDTILTDVAGAHDHVAALAEVGVDLDAVTARLQVDGVGSFADAYDGLLASVTNEIAALRPAATLALGPYDKQVAARLETWDADGYGRRLWAKDPTLWSAEPQPELTDRLGWLTLPDAMQAEVGELTDFADEVRADGVRHVVLLGMGGSSLAPEVFARTFGSAPGFPELIVLDSTHPDSVRAVDERIDPATTIFITASKSGTTLESLSFSRHYWAATEAAVPDPARHHVVITDPGTPLEKLARERGMRAFVATPDVGGRYSALTMFGLVPAALIGADVAGVLQSARAMAASAGPGAAAADNPGLVLGAALGELALDGRDKATFLVSASLAAFPGWVEQLIAESTGKDGTGIVPVADEPVGPPDAYGADRVFVYLSLAGDDDTVQRAAVDALERAGHPVLRFRLAAAEDLGAEMYRAEVAVTAAGSVLGIHPFNQPNVQMAKELAKQAMAGELDAGDVDEVAAADADRLAAELAGWLGLAEAGDYVSIQAYLAPTAGTTAALAAIRRALRDRLRLATTFGYGPRFLHSTGQLHKGGPNSGLFLQLVDEPAEDLAVPESTFGFGELIAGQALGDYQALRSTGRRVLRVNLGADPQAGIAALSDAVGRALDG